MGQRGENEEEDWVGTGRSIRREERCDCCSSLAIVVARADMVVVVLCCSDDDGMVC